jgi:hypothetical protein
LNFDRLKAGFIGAARAAFPRIDYLALYAGTIVAQGGANSFDVQPDDARVPGLSQVPIELGLPGLTLQLDLNSKPRCLIGWKNGNPALPYVTLFESGAAALKVTFDATELDLGAAAADFAVKGTAFFNGLELALTAQKTAIAAIPPATTLPTVIALAEGLRSALAPSPTGAGGLLELLANAFAAANLSTKVKVE